MGARAMTWRRFILATLLLLVVLVSSFAYYWRPYYGYTPIPFSREAWSIADAEQRGYMIKDLLASHVLDGKTRSDVSELLGSKSQPSEYMTYEVGYMGYNKNFPFVFSRSLLIEFDAEGRVERAYTMD